MEPYNSPDASAQQDYQTDVEFASIIVGVLMLTGSMTVMSTWLVRWTPEFLRSRL